jgi:hypothetical protein
LRLASRVAAIAAAFVCVILAFAPAWRAATVDWAYDRDHFRDIAAAQSMADGRWLDDPAYRGETLWYNPLLPATTAFVSKAASMPVSTTYVRLGPILSATAAITFFIAVAVLIDWWPAAISLAGLLFFPYDADAWARPSITPWIFPVIFASSFFYIGLCLCWRAMQRQTLSAWAFVGAWIGITFLAHTAPAVILGLCAAYAACSRAQPSIGASSSIVARLGVVTAGAVIAGAPLLWSIVWRYRLRVVNHAPFDWTWNEMRVEHFASVLATLVTSATGMLAIVGAVVLVRRFRSDGRARLVLCWTVSTVALVGYGYVQQIVAFDRVPPLVPQYHFYYYLIAAGHVLIGVAVWTIVSRLAALLGGHIRSTAVENVAAVGCAAALVGAFVRLNYDAYAKRPDFAEYYREAQTTSRILAKGRVVERLRAETPPDAVVLASTTESLLRVAPAGRRVITMPSEFSNPFVSLGERELDEDRLFAALAAGDAGTFASLAGRYGVTHVMLGPEEAALQHDASRTGLLRELSRRGGYILYAVGDAR